MPYTCRPMTLFLTKNLYFTKKIPSSHLFVSTSYLPAYPITLLLQILRGRMHGPSPHLKFWGGPSLQSTLSLRQCIPAHFIRGDRLIQPHENFIVVFCIVFIHLYSASCSAHQSEALSVRETQREEWVGIICPGTPAWHRLNCQT